MSRLLVRDRVVLAAVGVLAVGLVVLGVATNVVLSDRLDADAAQLLRERVTAQLATIDVSGGSVRDRRLDDSALDRQSWTFRGTDPIERPPAPAAVQAAAARLAAEHAPSERTVGATRLKAAPIVTPGGRRLGTVVVGISLEPYEHSERIARIATAVLAAFVLALGAFVTRRAVGAALRPVAGMAASATQWSEHELDRRFDMGPPRDELTALGATLDDLLGRIDAALRHEQRFSAEMAHELRTPLSGIRAEAELGLRTPDLPADARSSCEAILAACDRMAGAIDALLLAARVPGPRGSSDPREATREIAAAFASAAQSAGLTLTICDADLPLRVGAEREQVVRALAPLVDNAIAHAQGSVVVTTAAIDGVVTIAVADDGPGIPEDRRAAIFEPGASTRGGAGLGLALARRLARAFGGDVAAVPATGGARVELRLPGTVSPRL